MGNTTKNNKENLIRQIIHLKQVMRRWKAMSLKQKHARDPSDSDSDSESDSDHQIPLGFLAVYVGGVRMRFLIPTRFLKLPIFTYLLKIAEEEYEFKISGGIVLPCEVDFFKQVLRFLEEDEKSYGGLELHEFLKLIREVGFDSSSCKENDYSRQNFMPLLHKTRV
ncbi:hypothetical protein AB3S75_003067 [Citrus x aurantiifolia]